MSDRGPWDVPKQTLADMLGNFVGFLIVIALTVFVVSMSSLPALAAIWLAKKIIWGG